MKTFPKGGIHPKDCKLNADIPSSRLDLPKSLCIMVSQHLGAPSTPIVKAGDRVLLGQALTENTAFLSSVVHSPVSGTVSKIADVVDASGYPKPAIFIDVDGEEALEGIDLSQDLKLEIKAQKEEILEKVKSSGIVGMGGACFPTHVKLSIPKDAKAEFLLINGVECEPYLTDDYRLMLEKADEILCGIRLVMKALEVERAIIGIENNKPKAIELLKEKARALNCGIEVEALKLKYPQGAEKQLIKALTGREVPSGKLPISVGCVVCNVASCFAIYEAVQKNKPLIERLVTVSGHGVGTARNFWVKIGTPISELVAAVDCNLEEIGKIISGGPMMGKCFQTLDSRVGKGTSSILLVPHSEAHREKESNCIRCAKCVEVCPMGLEPYLLSPASRISNFALCEKHHVMDCIECGSCQFTCPAHRSLLDDIRVGKSKVANIIRNRNTK